MVWRGGGIVGRFVLRHFPITGITAWLGIWYKYVPAFCLFLYCFTIGCECPSTRERESKKKKFSFGVIAKRGNRWKGDREGETLRLGIHLRYPDIIICPISFKTPFTKKKNSYHLLCAFATELVVAFMSTGPLSRSSRKERRLPLFEARTITI